LLLGSEDLQWDRNSLESTIDDNSAIYDPLEATDQQVGLAKLKKLAHHDQPITGYDRFAKAYILEPPEPHDRIAEQLVFV
jgi:hypothetical protein